VTQDRIKLLYIASNGRSGSTILEMMLNANSRVWTLGEFHILPWEIRTNTKPCGCGTAVELCPFWEPIIRQHRKTIEEGTLTRFRRAHNVDRAVRIRELPFVFGRKAAYSRQRAAQIQRYASDNEDILRAVQEQTGAMRPQPALWLVDSSKSPYRLLWLAASGRFDLRVIHLTKDPRAFAYSMIKARRGASQAYWAARFAVRWQVQNRQVDAVIRHYLSPQHAIHLRYEELAAKPEATMERICHWLEIPFEPGAASRFRDGNHGIAGNPARAQSKPIQLDEKWRFELPSALARISLLINARLARRYGHPL
jgi:hypothetical protein